MNTRQIETRITNINSFVIKEINNNLLFISCYQKIVLINLNQYTVDTVILKDFYSVYSVMIDEQNILMVDRLGNSKTLNTKSKVIIDNKKPDDIDEQCTILEVNHTLLFGFLNSMIIIKFEIQYN